MSCLAKCPEKYLSCPAYPIIREIEWNAINLKHGNRLASRNINFYKAFIQGFKPSGKSNKAVHSDKRDSERLSTVILDMLSEVICNRFTEDAYPPRVVCTVFGFAR